MTHQQKSHATFKVRKGFTLVEMALVLTIMGLVIMTVFPALVSARRANEKALTQSNLRSLMLATAAYVQANGCLPCPAVPGGTRTKFGKLGYSSTTIACGDCSAAPEGLPPFVALGLPASTAKDGWGHWITMRVDYALTNPTNVIVPPTAPCTSTEVSSSTYGCTVVGSSVKGLCKAGTTSNGSSVSGIKITTTGNGATQYAAVIFVSHGSTGYGSYIAEPQTGGDYLTFPDNYAACGAGGYAQCNSAERNSAQFYDAPWVIDDAKSYDDILAYADRNALVSMLGNGACSTTW